MLDDEVHRAVGQAGDKARHGSGGEGSGNLAPQLLQAANVTWRLGESWSGQKEKGRRAGAD